MHQEQSEVVQTAFDHRSIEAGLRALWDRAKRAGELIALLRGENEELRARVAELQGEVLTLKQELTRREQAVAQAIERAGEEAKRHALVTNGERDALIARVRSLIARLDAYL